MPGRETEDVIFILRQVQKKFISKRKDLFFRWSLCAFTATVAFQSPHQEKSPECGLTMLAEKLVCSIRGNIYFQAKDDKFAGR